MHLESSHAYKSIINLFNLSNSTAAVGLTPPVTYEYQELFWGKISSLTGDLNVPLVKEVIKQRSTIYHNKIEEHVNVLIQPLLQLHNERRLKRNWPADLLEG
jgi:hypothetical protein